MAATFFPTSTIVDRAYRKAGMPDYQNVETIVAIPRVSDLYSTVKFKFSF